MELQFHPDFLVALGHRAAKIVPMPLYGYETPDDGQKDCPKHVEL
jgi:hypothetical protein